MSRIRLTIGFFQTESITASLIIVLLLVATTVFRPEIAQAQEVKTDKQQVNQQVAQNWIEIGTRQYQRNLFQQAEESLLQAENLKKHLTTADRQKLDELLKTTRQDCRRRDCAAELIREADDLVNKGQLIIAKPKYEQVKDSQGLTEKERQHVTESLDRINSHLNRQKKRIMDLYGRAMQYYNIGRITKARECFMKIDSILIESIKPSASTEPISCEDVTNEVASLSADKSACNLGQPAQKFQPQTTQAPSKYVPIAATDSSSPKPVTDKAFYTSSSTDSKANIRRSYTKAIVKNAIAKAQDYIDQSRFDKAKTEIEAAMAAVTENKLYLGNELFAQYLSELKLFNDKIARQKTTAIN